MFKNLSDFLSVLSLTIIVIYSIRLFIWSFSFDSSARRSKQRETIYEQFRNYIDNEDE